MRLTDEQVSAFDEQGVVTVDTPLTEQEIADACAAMDRLLPFDGRNPRPSRTCDYFDPALVDLLQHPFFEEVARQVLRADRVFFFQTAILNAYPEPEKPFGFWQHVDLQYRRSDFESTPRNLLCSFFLWLTDVNEQRAPMMVRPGSHLLLADENEKDQDWPAVPMVAPVPEANLPKLPYADPIPLVARAGQVSVLTTATVHGASVNVDTERRRNLVLTFHADSVTIGLPAGEEQQKRDYHRALRPLFRPERVGILPEPE
ncbi:MAG: phytanoyl-CoA dioxygenase family protein [Capsulimonadales bacterium]|nr:phytanoyl-CoA dioxygenase family protein [Capsulimonadales bacterium]